MPIKEIKISPLFEKHYRKLPKRIKERAKEKEKIFKENPFHPTLRTHKLFGGEGNIVITRLDVIPPIFY